MRKVHSHQSRPNRAIGITVLAAALAVSGGCAQNGRWTRADYDLGYEQPPHESELQDLSARIYLISDNQRHELLGNGVELFRTSLSDKVTKVAIRPPQLDLFGQDLMGEALAVADGFVLHLGDACDISNTGEFGRFAWDMRRAPHGWVMAPGNHDGFFFGNSSRTLEGLIQEWHESAETYEFDGSTITSRAMQKDRFVSYYLAALILQDEIWSAPLAHTLGPEIEKRFANWTRGDNASSATQFSGSFTEYWNEMVELQEEIYRVADTNGDQAYLLFELPAELAPSGQPHLRRLAWHIDKKRVWRSFVLQEVDISASSAEAASKPDPISILVIDTSQYGVQPSLDHGVISRISRLLTFNYFDFQVAGEHGNILDSQEAATDAFAESMTEERRSWMLATHHPYDSLGRRTYRRFDKVRDAGRIPVTLSGHTHAGEIRWNHDRRREGDWLEINVGSILDSPVEFRDLQVHRLGDRIAVTSRRQMLEDLLREQGLIAGELAGYRPDPADADFYLNYTSGLFGTEEEADFMVKRILLATYLRMLRLFEADHPDQSSTVWPTGPDGMQLRSHKAVTGAVQTMLSDVRIADIEALTRFLYELREFDRTRQFSDVRREQLRAYRLSQAIWASRTEFSTWKPGEVEMDPNISFLLLPGPAVETAAQSTSQAAGQ